MSNWDRLNARSTSQGSHPEKKVDVARVPADDQSRCDEALTEVERLRRENDGLRELNARLVEAEDRAVRARVFAQDQVAAREDDAEGLAETLRQALSALSLALRNYEDGNA